MRVDPVTTEQPRIFTFKLPPADFAELEALARAGERSVGAEIRLAVRAWLIDQRTKEEGT